MLKAEAQPRYYPLYKLSLEELKIAKKYILKNLQKGFIIPSSSLYTSPILIAKKLGGGLHFYIDFRRLNTIIKKDYYPLPLINKVIQQISKAKIYTKLNI